MPLTAKQKKKLTKVGVVGAALAIGYAVYSQMKGSPSTYVTEDGGVIVEAAPSPGTALLGNGGGGGKPGAFRNPFQAAQDRIQLPRNMGGVVSPGDFWRQV